jgi:6-phosphofructokinase 1
LRPVVQPDGSVEHQDVSHEALDRMAKMELDAVIVAGGDGTMAIAHRLVQMGARLVGVPKTIDNDLGHTDVTFGFDTAIRTATDALEKLRTTAESHHRIMVLEVMGRNAGWIAVTAGIAGGADAILIPEIPFNIEVVCGKIKALQASGRRYSLVVVAEGAAPAGGDQEFHIEGESDEERRLGGVGYTVGARLAECVEAEVRVTVLGHLQRGGTPTPRDRFLATACGAEAAHLVKREAWGQMVALKGGHVTSVPMEDAVQMKFVDPQGDIVQVARDLGIVFG